MSQLDQEQVAPVASRLVSVDGKTYPMESAQIVARAQGGFAMSTLAQVFKNPYDEPLEVVYTLPLPADGAVLAYTVKVGDRVIRGEVQPREKAAKAYKEALFQGRTAGLLEQQRVDTFEQRLGNIPGKTQVEVTIDVLHPLAFERIVERFSPSELVQCRDCGPGFSRPDATWTYRFPTVVGVRYHGAPGRVSDAQTLSPDRGEARQIPVRMGFTLSIADDMNGFPGSESHRLEFVDERTVRFVEGETLDRDIVVRWAATTQDVGVHVSEGPGLPGDDGRYALVTVVPPSIPQAKFARDLIVLLDSSGSMGGEPIELAKVVVGDLLRSLEPGDHFEVLEFSNDVSPLTQGRVPFNDGNLGKALAALARVEANGGTEMSRALAKAMQSVSDDSQRQVVLVTDGGISFEHEVVAQAASKRNVRLHVVGVGHVPNRALTQQAAAAGRGLEVLVGSHSEAAASSAKLIAGMAAPVLTQIELVGTALAGDKPKGLRDVFAGKPLTFAVELSRKGGTLTLRGELAGQEQPWTQRIDVPASEKGSLPTSPLPVGALFGRERVAQLELEHASSGYHWYEDERPGTRGSIEQQIERVAMRHLIVSRRTSMIAISEDVTVDPQAPKRRERVAVEIPAGVSAEGLEREFMAPCMALDSLASSLVLHQYSAPAAMSAPPARRLNMSEAMFKRMPKSAARADSMDSDAVALPPGGSAVHEVDVIRFEGGELVVEADAEALLSGTPAKVLLVTEKAGERSTVELTFEPSLSTRPEGLQPGQRVMLVFRFNPEAARDLTGSARLTWTTENGEVQCAVALPAPDGAGQAPTARPEE